MLNVEEEGSFVSLVRRFSIMFHISTLAGFGHNLRPFADLDGYVPEVGDYPTSFRWDEAVEWSQESWSEFVEKTQKQTRAVLQNRELWQYAS